VCWYVPVHNGRHGHRVLGDVAVLGGDRRHPSVWKEKRREGVRVLERTSVNVKNPLLASSRIPPLVDLPTYTHVHLPVVKARAHQGRVLDVHPPIGQGLQRTLDGVVGKHAVSEHDHTRAGKGGQQEEGGGEAEAEHGLVVWL